MIRGRLRSALNWAGGDLRLVKRLPAAFGRRRVVVTPLAYLRYWTASLGAIHRELLGVLDQVLRPGDCFWDIGANVGVATFAAAQLVGRTGSVLAIEPDVDVCGLLHQTMRLGDPDEATVDVLPVALADQTGISRFAVSSHGSTTSALTGFGRFPGVRVERTVPTYTLDWLLAHFRPPDFLKIDVEGAELLVLRGGLSLLEIHRPILTCEVTHDLASLIGNLLNEQNYKLYDMCVRPDCRVALDAAPGELLAVPAEKIVLDGRSIVAST